MLDKLPAPVRHSALMLLSALLAWAVEALPGLNLPPIWAGIAGVVITQAIAFVTPLTKQYGVGKK